MSEFNKVRFWQGCQLAEFLASFGKTGQILQNHSAIFETRTGTRIEYIPTSAKYYLKVADMEKGTFCIQGTTNTEGIQGVYMQGISDSCKI